MILADFSVNSLPNVMKFYKHYFFLVIAFWRPGDFPENFIEKYWIVKS